MFELTVCASLVLSVVGRVYIVNKLYTLVNIKRSRRLARRCDTTNVASRGDATKNLRLALSMDLSGSLLRNSCRSTSVG